MEMSTLYFHVCNHSVILLLLGIICCYCLVHLLILAYEALHSRKLSSNSWLESSIMSPWYYYYLKYQDGFLADIVTVKDTNKDWTGIVVYNNDFLWILSDSFGLFVFAQNKTENLRHICIVLIQLYYLTPLLFKI